MSVKNSNFSVKGGESSKNSTIGSTSSKDKKHEILEKSGSDKTSVIPTHSRNQSKLMLARDSVILLITSNQRKSSISVGKFIDNISTERTLKFEKTDDISDDIHSQKSLETDHKKNSSKLLQATDSYDIIKSTLTPISSNNEKSRKTELSFSTKLDVGHKRESRVIVPNKRKISNYPKPKPHPIIKKKSISLNKPNKQFKDDGFSDERIKNLVNMMKENPSLIRLFTTCIK